MLTCIVLYGVVLLVAGHAGVMGAAPAKREHLQDGAEAEPAGGLGRAELLRHLLQGAARVQVHDQHQVLK